MIIVPNKDKQFTTLDKRETAIVTAAVEYNYRIRQLGNFLDGTQERPSGCTLAEYGYVTDNPLETDATIDELKQLLQRLEA